jgi:hypothetical protein
MTRKGNPQRGPLVLLASCLAIVCWSVSIIGIRSQPTLRREPTDPKRALFEEVKALRGKDLLQLSERASKGLLSKLTRLIPKRTYREFLDFCPWYIWDFHKRGERAHYALLEVRGSPLPGTTTIRVTLLSDAGKVVSESIFTTGYRCYAAEARLVKPDAQSYPVLVLETGPGGGPGAAFRQYYAWVDDRFDLIRLEYLDGEAARNAYYQRDNQCGPEIVRRTVQEWQAELASNDPLRLLRALVWVGGIHLGVKPGELPNDQAEEAHDILLVRAVRGRGGVVSRLKELAESKVRWVREAARLAQNPEDVHIKGLVIVPFPL